MGIWGYHLVIVHLNPFQIMFSLNKLMNFRNINTTIYLNYIAWFSKTNLDSSKRTSKSNNKSNGGNSEQGDANIRGKYSHRESYKHPKESQYQTSEANSIVKDNSISSSSKTSRINNKDSSSEGNKLTTEIVLLLIYFELYYSFLINEN